MDGAGRGAGEPPEAAWAFLGRCGKLLQYASLPGRHPRLERMIAYHNLKKLESLPNLLLRMYQRAQAGLEDATQSFANIISIPMPDDGTDQLDEVEVKIRHLASC